MMITAALVGICYGCWPLVGNRTGLHGTVSVLFYGLLNAIIVFPLVYKDIPSIGKARWMLAICAGSIAVMGNIMFNGLLSKAPKEEISILIVIALITNAIVQGINHTIQNHGLSGSKAIGFVFAVCAILLLLRK